MDDPTEDLRKGLIRVIQCLENPDIIEAIKSQDQAYLDLVGVALKPGMKLKNVESALKNVLGKFNKLLPPLIVNGKLNKSCEDYKDLRERKEENIRLYQQLERIYDQFFSSIRYIWKVDRLQFLETKQTLCQPMEAFETELKNRRRPNITIWDIFKSFHAGFETLSKLLIILASAIHMELDGKRFENPNRIDALSYLNHFDPMFMPIYDANVDRTFRNMPAHLKIIQLEDQKFYYIKDNKKILFNTHQLYEAFYKIDIYGRFILDIFFEKPLRREFEIIKAILKNR